MLESRNHVELVGQLAYAPDVKPTASGLQVCQLKVATEFRSRGKTYSEQHNVVAFAKLAEACAQLQKDSWVRVEGRLQTSSWQGKDGTKRTGTSIIAAKVDPVADASQPEAPEEAYGL
jgi:single-strand DNA-binding protein